MEVFNEQLPNILAKITTQRLSELPTTTTQEEREQLKEKIERSYRNEAHYFDEVYWKSLYQQLKAIDERTLFPPALIQVRIISFAILLTMFIIYTRTCTLLQRTTKVNHAT